MSFAGSIQIIFFSMLTCTIGSQGGPNKMAAANFLWLHFLNNRSLIQSFFLDQWSWSGSLLLSRDECRFQLTVESDYEIVIATLGDWLTNPATVFQRTRGKTNSPIALWTRGFSRALSKLQVIPRNSQWFIALFAEFAISPRNYFRIGRQSFETTLSETHQLPLITLGCQRGMNLSRKPAPLQQWSP